MAVIDPEGLFNGDRLRRCSNAAQLHWPRLFLASDGFARLEINYACIIGKAYATFNPVPSETELPSFLEEYVKNHLLFMYEADGRICGQWDTRRELLPRYKTAQDRRSPIPPEPAFSDWEKAYRSGNKVFPKSLGNFSESFLHGVGVGVGKNTCASHTDARLGGSLSIDNPPFGTTEPDGVVSTETAHRAKPSREFTAEQDRWFTTWWIEYWRRVAKKRAREAFRKQVRTEGRFQQVMAATRAQKPEMLTREESKQPHGATWLNDERWEDETTSVAPSKAQDDYPELPS